MRNNIVLAAKLYAVPFIKRTTHYRGFPPALTNDTDMRQEMIRPAFLTIELEAEGAYLYRYTSDGKYVGDTWSFTIEEAKEQAETEFNGYFSDWQEIAKDIDDPVAFIVDHLSIFDAVYHIVVVAEKIPPHIVSLVISDVLNAFTSRPWNRNVMCVWNEENQTLTLQAENDFDKNGSTLREEFFDEIFACAETITIEDVHVVSVTSVTKLGQ